MTELMLQDVPDRREGGPFHVPLAPREPIPFPIPKVRFLHRDQLPQIRDQWAALADRALGDNVFLHPDFALPALDHIDPALNVGAWIVEVGNTMTGLLIGRRVGLLSGRLTATALGWNHRFAPLGTPLIARDGAHVTWIALLSHLSLEEGLSALNLPMMELDGEADQALTEALRRTGRSSVILNAHQRAYARFPDAPENQTANPRQAKNQRRLDRRLADRGVLREISTTKGLSANEAIDTYINIEIRSWKGRGGTAIGLAADEEAFFRAMLPAMLKRKAARIDITTLDGLPITATIVLYQGKTAFYFKTAYDESLARYSPGVRASAHITEELAAESRATSADSCAIAGHPMIEHLWRRRKAIGTRLVSLSPGTPGPSFRLAVQAESLRKRLRSAAKTLINALRVHPY